ncbi:hypothetical protein HanIR_Chr04g0181331 [Helianthus annuus]|nr:hypothetical protein HanIR_Chr04g0181331 [Helianthus annuus]
MLICCHKKDAIQDVKWCSAASSSELQKGHIKSSKTIYMLLYAKFVGILSISTSQEKILHLMVTTCTS